MRTVLFFANFQRFQGGHLKVFQYFEHVRSAPSFQARIRLTADSVRDASNPWSQTPDAILGPEEEIHPDLLFLAGMNWRWLEPEQREQPPVPIVNLIQSMWHARPTHPLHQFLAYPAIRICVSAELQQALEGLGTVNGPIFTNPIGLDLERLPPAHAAAERDIDCLVLGVKNPPLGRAIAARLTASAHRILLVDRAIPRGQLLELMARARVTVHLPEIEEGAYLPALESMALGSAVVCPDCIGNRSFCRDGDTCLVPERSEQAIAQSALAALSMSAQELEQMLAAGRTEANEHALSAERARFLEILDRVDELWKNM